MNFKWQKGEVFCNFAIVMTILITIGCYFMMLLLISRIVGKGGNDAFFRGNRQSPWPIVAIGMVGASLSGVTFVSVPGMVLTGDMTYIQMCLGFIVGYFLIAFVLLPIYYKHRLTSIYSYLGDRFGSSSRKTGSAFFLLSKLTGAAARLYLVCFILQRYAFDSQFTIGSTALQIPFVVVVLLTLLLIWLYTRTSGIKAIVWTDFLQTIFLIGALVLILLKAGELLGMGFGESMQTVLSDSKSRMFEFGDWNSKQHFVKQFLSGVFITIVMTGLDQDMMQKNLSCKDLRSSQKDMCFYGLLFTPVNFLFLSLGVLLTHLYQQHGMVLPLKGDALLPDFVASGLMGDAVLVFFTIGIIAAAFSSADSALTSLTTSFCIDILEIEQPASRYFAKKETTRKWVHLCMIVVFTLFIIAFKALDNPSVIDAIYTIAGYTYGPLLGLFAFGIFTKRMPSGKWTPLVAILSPIICYCIDLVVMLTTGYKFGYEMLMFNGLLTFSGLWLISSGVQEPPLYTDVK